MKKSKTRIFVDQKITANLIIYIKNKQHHFLKNVLRTKINDKIKSELNKEWRDYEDPEKLKEILGELAKDKEILESVKPGERKDTKETLLEKIEKEIYGENRPDVIRDLENKMAILEEDEV